MGSNNGVLGYIHDGYTRPGYIAAEKYLHPALRFQFRPMLAQNRTVIYRQIDKANDPRREEEIAAKAIASQLTEWDLLNEKGEVVAIESAEVLRVEPNLMSRLFKIVTGVAVTDEDPDWVDEEKQARYVQELERALAGTGPDHEEAADEKNSVKG